MNKTFFLLIAFIAIAYNQVSAQCCTYRLITHDSYGDGWNGATLEVIVNSSSLGLFSASDAGSIDSIQICSNDSIKLIYSAGDYEEENSYALVDAAYNTVFSSGPTPPTGLVLATIADCSALPVPGLMPCNAIEIDTTSCILADNTNFPNSGFIANCANFSGSDIWFHITIPPSGNLNFITQNGNLTDTGLAAWIAQNNDCNQLQLIACDDDGGSGYYSMLSVFDASPGQDLYIQAFGFGGGTGNFEICVQDLGTVDFTGSELPIVVINTLGETIIQESKVNVWMDIKYNGDGNYTYITDSSNVYSSHVGIEIRGATSASFPQKPYGFETRDDLGENLDVSLLGMPAENDWVLLSNYNDRSLIRNTLATKLFAQMGNYSSRMRLCEVMVDDSYKGIYVFGEKIKRDANRVDIAKLNSFETSGDDLTGGYILTQNYWEEFNSFQSNYTPIGHPEMDVHFVFEYPKPDSISIQQKTYIANYVDSLETALYGNQFADLNLGYRHYLDVNSFIDYFLINELSRNNDGFKKSVFFYKDKNSNGGKLHAGPVWDFDFAWKNLSTCSIFEATDGSGWAHEINDCFTDNPSCGWYLRMLQDSLFQNELRCRYDSFRGSFLSNESIHQYIDSVGSLVINAEQRHFKRWPILGVEGLAPELEPIPTTYAEELETLKSWIDTRLAWLDLNIPGNCFIAPTGFSNHTTSRIHVMPNPSKGNIQFSGWNIDNAAKRLVIFGMNGSKVMDLDIATIETNVSIQLNQAGIYLYQLYDVNGILSSGKLVVTE